MPVLKDTITVEDITPILAGKKNDDRFSANIEYDGHEKILYAYAPSIGFKAFIAVHNTNLGQALGGCRFRSDYAHEQDAITDVLRLSKGMTYKNAVAGLDLGGGKAVIMGTSGQDKPTAAQLHALGYAVEQLDGAYVTAEDMDMDVDAILTVREETLHVAGIPLSAISGIHTPQDFDRSSFPGANPSPYTAYGTFVGMKAAIKHRYGALTFNDLKVSVKGAAGAVGHDICRLLAEDGATLYVSDRDDHAPSQEKLKELAKDYNAQIVSSDEIMKLGVNMYAPCATGGDINDETIENLNVDIIAGCANNVLQTPSHAKMLMERDVLYAPDYVINSGGVIAVGVQHLWITSPEKYQIPTHMSVKKRIESIGDVLAEIFIRSENQKISTAKIADMMGLERYSKLKLAGAA